MFPLPTPWRQVGTVDPEREYVAFTSRFPLRSALRVPAFLLQTFHTMRTASSAPGIVGWSLAANLPTLEFHTLSAWEDTQSLRTFIASSAHREAREKFANDMRAASLQMQFTVSGSELPLSWKDAIARQNARLAATAQER